MKGRDIWCSLLDEASDNSVAEIMDSEILCSFSILQARPENLRVWFIPLLDIWFIRLILLKMFSIMKKTIFLVYR
jgi:hypothetical protein